MLHQLLERDAQSASMKQDREKSGDAVKMIYEMCTSKISQDSFNGSLVICGGSMHILMYFVNKKAQIKSS